MEPGCICSSLPNLAHVPMGGDGLDERLLANLEGVKDYGEPKWWLYLGRCRDCAQDWLVAQDERIFDEHFLSRLTSPQAEDIMANNVWPETFISYERVLRIGLTLSTPCRFFDPMASSLVWAVDDLRNERPDISTVEIAELLGVSVEQAAKLVVAAGPQTKEKRRSWARIVARMTDAVDKVIGPTKRK